MTYPNNQGNPSGAIPVYIGITAGNGGSQTAIGGTITTSNTYQLVAAAGTATHGGLIENTSPSGTAILYADWTAGIVAGGTTLSAGATALGAMPSASAPGGKQQIPPTTNAVFVYGPSGATFSGSVS
jgi:hypothetical protein